MLFYMMLRQLSQNWCYLHKVLLKTEVISYCASIAVLWFINYHCGVTRKADFPVSNVRGDGQSQVSRSPKPWAV